MLRLPPPHFCRLPVPASPPWSWMLSATAGPVWNEAGPFSVVTPATLKMPLEMFAKTVGVLNVFAEYPLIVSEAKIEALPPTRVSELAMKSVWRRAALIPEK